MKPLFSRLMVFVYALLAKLPAWLRPSDERLLDAQLDALHAGRQFSDERYIARLRAQKKGQAPDLYHPIVPRVKVTTAKEPTE